MFVQQFQLTGVAASGALALQTSDPVRGRLVEVQYIAPGSNAFSSGFGLTVTGATTGKTYFSKSNISGGSFVARPKIQHQSGADGTDLTGVYDYAFVASEPLVITLASAGNGTTGTFNLLVS